MTVTSDILITGAGGFTGQHACRYFASQGYRVTALTHKQHLKDPTDDQVKEVKGDLLDWKQVRDLVKTVRPRKHPSSRRTKSCRRILVTPLKDNEHEFFGNPLPPGSRP